VRIVMGLREFFRKRGTSKRASLPSRAAAGDRSAPKNGRLTLAVIAAILLMLVLAALNVRLILDPSIAVKAFGPRVPSRPEPQFDVAAGASCPASATKASPAPPQVTFYSKLIAQEDQTHCQEGLDPRSVVRQGGSEAPSYHAPPEETKLSEKHPEKKTKNRASLQPKEPDRHPPAETSLPGPDSGTGTYMVQVGAFTNPGIAQQWAARWKSRGYDVMLKPVARPKTGILYRLYLGKFGSQQEADALVERLKTKEGITAFRLLVRN
jgi:cell division septation protein DedD